jgi:cobalt-zinc-cadmium efflux system membrane fusion protein
MRTKLIAVGMLTAAACHSVKEENTTPIVPQGDTISLPNGSALNNRIKISTVAATTYRREMATAGIVKAIPTQYAEIASPFQGRVTKSFLQLGMKTQPGTPLFEISSPDFIAAQKSFFQEKTQLQQAERTWKRQQDLMANGVGTQKDLEEAQTAYEVEKKEYENAVMGIRIFKANPEQLSLGQPLVVRAPIAGEVIDNKVVLGQFIKDDASSVATIANLSDVWMAAQVKEKDIRFIQTGDECNIEVMALPGKLLKGKVYHVNAVVEEDTRSIQVLIAVPNTDHALKPGMYTTVNFIAKPGLSLVLANSCLLQADSTPYVLVATAPGKFVKRPVTTNGTSNQQVVITSGLSVGERIVTEGAFYLLDAK